MKQEEIDNIFTYHKPFGNQQQIYEAIREQGQRFASYINDVCLESREKSLAITSLQQTVMWANAAIAIHEKEK